MSKNPSELHTWSEFQIGCETTLTPNCRNLTYLTGLLVTETIEVSEAHRSHKANEQDILLEIGDCLYALATLPLINRAYAVPDDLIHAVWRLNVPPVRVGDAEMARTHYRLTKAAASILDVHIKCVRAPEQNIQREAPLGGYMSHVFTMLQQVANWHGVTLAECGELVLAKLRSRAEAGIITSHNVQ